MKVNVQILYSNVFDFITYDSFAFSLTAQDL